MSASSVTVVKFKFMTGFVFYNFQYAEYVVSCHFPISIKYVLLEWIGLYAFSVLKDMGDKKNIKK